MTVILPDDLTYDRIILNELKLSVQSRIQLPETDFNIHRAGSDLILTLEASLASEKLGEFKREISFRCPSSWWQHFKQEYFPNWLQKKYPIKYKTVRKKIIVHLNALYPKAPRMDKGCFQEFIIHSKIEVPKSDIEINECYREVKYDK